MSSIKVVWACGHTSLYDEEERKEKGHREIQGWAKDKACPVCYRDMLRSARVKIRTRKGVAAP